MSADPLARSLEVVEDLREQGRQDEALELLTSRVIPALEERARSRGAGLQRREG